MGPAVKTIYASFPSDHFQYVGRELWVPRIYDLCRYVEVNGRGDDICEGGDSIVDVGSVVYFNRRNVCGNEGFKAGPIGLVVVKDDMLGGERWGESQVSGEKYGEVI